MLNLEEMIAGVNPGIICLLQVSSIVILLRI